MLRSSASIGILFCILFNIYIVHSYRIGFRPKNSKLSSFRADDLDRSFPELKDDIDMKPKISVRDFDEEKREEERISRQNRQNIETRSVSMNTNKPFGSFTIDKIKSFDTGRRFSDKAPQKEDLNGVDPFQAIMSSTIPAGMAVVGYFLTSYLIDHLAVQFLDSDVYPIQRAAVVIRNLIIGMSTLATTFAGVVSLGLLGMGVAVTVGVLKGELDPNKKDTVVTKSDDE